MSYQVGTISFGSTGAQSCSFTGTPTRVRVTVGSKFGSSESYNHKSEGMSDGTNTFCVSNFQDTTGGKTINNTSGKIVSHWERVGGTLTEVLAVNFTSFTLNNINFNVGTANANYQLIVEAET